MTIGTNTFLLTEIPSSLLPISSNVNPPPYSRGPSSRHVATSQIGTAVSGGYVHVSRGQIATSTTYIPTAGMYIPTCGTYLPTYGVSHGASQAMTYGPYYGA